MAAKYLQYTYDQLNTFCMDAFQKFGFSESEARIISDVLLLSDLYGIESHGMQRLVRKLVFRHCDAPQQTPFDAAQHGSELFRSG